MSRMFTFITTFHAKNSTERLDEIFYCLKRNQVNNCIREIIVFLEQDGDSDNIQSLLEQQNIRVIPINHWPTFGDIFKWCNLHLAGQKIIFSNADIFFPDQNSLKWLLKSDLARRFAVLSRYNQVRHLSQWVINRQTGIRIRCDGLELRSQHDNGSSIDSWIFQAPIEVVHASFDIKIGTVTCDGFMNSEIAKVRKIFNPCLDVISIHCHKDWSPRKYQYQVYNGVRYTQREYQNLMENKGHSNMFVPFCHVSWLFVKLKKYRVALRSAWQRLTSQYGIFKST